MAKQTGLGQGVNVLFGQESDDDNYFECDVTKIVPNKHQPRNHFNDQDISELADSIRENGIIQPLIVTHSDEPGIYELIAGERRLRASKLAKLTTVPVVVLQVTDENALLEMALIENVQRTDLNPIEEAEAYNKLIEKFGYTQEETAKKVGKKRSTITNLLRLLNLPQFIKDDVVEGVLSEGHARALLRLSDDPLKMKEVRELILKKNLSVRQTEKLIRNVSSTSTGQSKTPSQKETEIPASLCNTLSNQLTNKLHSRIAIIQNGSRGKIEIEYYSLDDLERLISLIVND